MKPEAAAPHGGAAAGGDGALGSGADEGLDDLTFLAARICNTPIAWISFARGDRDWLAAPVGIEISARLRDTSLGASDVPCASLRVIPDARSDGRFATDPLVIGGPGIRFYAGAPLEMPDGSRIGTLSVADR